ncbi:hypothetical protein [Streptomyces cinereoruber]
MIDDHESGLPRHAQLRPRGGEHRAAPDRFPQLSAPPPPRFLNDAA